MLDRIEDPEHDPDAIDKARAILAAKFSGGKKARKEREKKVRTAVDGRSLRTTGRTEQFNVKVRPDIKAGIAASAEASGMKIADWIEDHLERILGIAGE
jgi:hypothetical protein